MDKNHRNENPSDLQSSESRHNLHPDAVLSAAIISWLSKKIEGIVVVINTNNEIEYISDSVYGILGYEPKEIIGKTWVDSPIKIDSEIISQAVVDDQMKHKKLLIDIPTKEGEELSFSCELNYIFQDIDVEKRFLIYLEKKAEDTRLDDLMIRSEKMNVAGQLAASLAHEIRNPLTSLKGFLQLLQAGAQHKEEYFNVMIEEVEKIESITSELLFISKPLTDNRSKEKITKMMKDVELLLQSQANQKNIQIQLQSSTDASILCDRSQIKQVLINLVKNAIEAMDQSGKIIVEAKEVEHKVRLSVIDEGCGLPEDILHRLGEPFFTTKTSGTGLGLLITKKILHNHDADFHMYNNEHKGSTFEIIFPKADNEVEIDE
ncbi:ATP-binding protein [Oceanobacillus jeddahense]|uniref:histidine kinase n=1 Tax=Oceanobacillus jeddahense TaxID=1462527 RepID=A0ABY5JLU8_9BACI|nr:ATP-binding protein [Oceanobacillus jeddahense]UUI01280.1 ATP-binding protein [Oceanobacillus jeddahense]